MSVDNVCVRVCEVEWFPMLLTAVINLANLANSTLHQLVCLAEYLRTIYLSTVYLRANTGTAILAPYKTPFCLQLTFKPEAGFQQRKICQECAIFPNYRMENIKLFAPASSFPQVYTTVCKVWMQELAVAKHSCVHSTTPLTQELQTLTARWKYGNSDQG